MREQSEQRQIVFCFILAIISLAVTMGIKQFTFTLTPMLPLIIQQSIIRLAQTVPSIINDSGYLVSALCLSALSQTINFKSNMLKG